MLVLSFGGMQQISSYFREPKLGKEVVIPELIEYDVGIMLAQFACDAVATKIT